MASCHPMCSHMSLERESRLPAGLLDQRQRVASAALSGGDVGQPKQISRQGPAINRSPGEGAPTPPTAPAPHPAGRLHGLREGLHSKAMISVLGSSAVVRRRLESPLRQARPGSAGVIMSENNLRIVRRFLDEVWSQGNYAVADELLAESHVHHLGEDELRGPAAVKEFAASLRSAFPDLRFSIEDELAEASGSIRASSPESKRPGGQSTTAESTCFTCAPGASLKSGCRQTRQP